MHSPVTTCHPDPAAALFARTRFGRADLALFARAVSQPRLHRDYDAVLDAACSAWRQLTTERPDDSATTRGAHRSLRRLSGKPAGRLYWARGVAATQNGGEILLARRHHGLFGRRLSSPGSMCRRAYRNLIYFRDPEKGGHFAGGSSRSRLRPSFVPRLAAALTRDRLRGGHIVCCRTSRRCRVRYATSNVIEKTMSTIVKAAAVQISPVLYSRQGTIDKIVTKISELGKQGVQFATFPETVVPYYPYFAVIQTPPQNIAGPELRKLLDQSVTVPSAATDAIGAAARQAGVVVSIGINERDGGTLYNTQLLLDADGALIQRRRKITPTYYERMIWGQGDGSGLRAVDSKVDRIGQLACWEHYNPLARYAMMADGEQIHSAMYPGSIYGDLFAEQALVNIRQHALESGCFVVCATAWLHPHQQAQLSRIPAGASARSRGVLDRDRRARWQLACRARPLGRRRGDRRSRLHVDRQTQAGDGLARSLQPARVAQSADRPQAHGSRP